MFVSAYIISIRQSSSIHTSAKISSPQPRTNLQMTKDGPPPYRLTQHLKFKLTPDIQWFLPVNRHTASNAVSFLPTPASRGETSMLKSITSLKALAVVAFLVTSTAGTYATVTISEASANPCPNYRCR